MDDRPDLPSRRMAGPGIIAIGMVLAVIVIMLVSASPRDTVVTPTKNGVTPTLPAPQSTTVTPTTPQPTTGPTQPAPPASTPAPKPPQ